MQELQNEFSWSKSRHEKFAECRRLYYFTYYGAWGGWRADAPALARELYLLKKLSNRFQWAGNVVHDTIRAALTQAKAGVMPSMDRMSQFMLLRMRNEWRLSRDHRYRVSEPYTKRALGLVEHEYAEPVANEEWKRNADNAMGSLKRFFEGPYLARARTLRPDQWLSIDELDAFLLEGVRVFAAPDFAYREDDGTAYVVDWKTGRPREGEDEQVQGYVLFAQHKWGVDPARTTAKLVYLGSGEERAVQVNEAALEKFRGHFRESVEGMRALLEHPERNLPREIEQFPQTEDRRRCGSCSFRRVCGR
ncbi:MAG: PD-(D/E)XK nuclease family protein [Deltaproteobacteria bacterium]|nr:PD-(D/E)XK nuclease family protein [Deltaproteobacteria bacterium]